MNALLEVLNQIPLNVFGWTIIHTLWIGLGIWLIYLIGKRTFPRSSNFKYAWAYSMQILLFITFFSSMAYEINSNISNEFNSKNSISVLFQESSNQEFVNSQNGESTIGIMKILDSLSPFLACIWILGTFLMMLRFATGMFYVNSLKQTGTVKIEQEFLDLFNSLKTALGLKRKVKLFESEMITSPLTIGHFKPIILMPIGLMSNLNSEQLEAILLHELAHIKRYDYLLNIVQNIVESFIYFHPVTWILSEDIKNERENLCDDFSIHTQKDPIHLAKALMEIEKHIGFTPSLAMGLGSEKNKLKKRVFRLFNKEIDNTYRFRALVPIVSFAIIIITLLSFKSKAILSENDLNINSIEVIAENDVIAPENPKNEVVKVKATLPTSDLKKVIKKPEATFKPVPRTISVKKSNSFFIVTDDNKNGESSQIELKTKTQDGKKIQIVFSDPDHISSLKIDGKKIPKSEYDNYKKILDENVFGKMSFSNSSKSSSKSGTSSSYSYSYSDDDDDNDTKIVISDGKNESAVVSKNGTTIVIDSEGIKNLTLGKNFTEEDLEKLLEGIFEDSFKGMDDISINFEFEDDFERTMEKCANKVAEYSMNVSKLALEEAQLALNNKKLEFDEKMSKEDRKKIEKEIAEAKEEIAKELANLKEEQKRMNVEYAETKRKQVILDNKLDTLLEQLVKDKVIDDKDDDVKVEFSKGKVFINKKEQNSDVAKKYRDLMGVGETENLVFERN